MFSFIFNFIMPLIGLIVLFFSIPFAYALLDAFFTMDMPSLLFWILMLPTLFFIYAGWYFFKSNKD